MQMFRQLNVNGIELKHFPFQLELVMESYLVENEDLLKLDTENFADVNVLAAEVQLKNGRKTADSDGRIDLIARYEQDYLAIIELKNDEINEKHLTQLKDYLNEREQLLEVSAVYKEFNNDPKWVGVLVGTSISPQLQMKLQDGYVTENGIPIAGLVLKRFRGPSNEIFITTDTFFKYNYSNRDFSKFKFNGEIYNKSRLVNSVIKLFVDQNPTIKFAELQKAFPQHLQGSMGVFDEKESAEEVLIKTGHKRHYLKPEELIKISDSIIATSTQWGVKNIEGFMEHVNNMNNNLSITPA